MPSPKTTLCISAISFLISTAAVVAWGVSTLPEAPHQVAAEGEPMLFPSDLRVSGPDQFGVVCYTFGSRAVSCVQAMAMVATPKQEPKP